MFRGSSRLNKRIVYIGVKKLRRKEIFGRLNLDPATVVRIDFNQTFQKQGQILLFLRTFFNNEKKGC